VEHVSSWHSSCCFVAWMHGHLWWESLANILENFTVQMFVKPMVCVSDIDGDLLKQWMLLRHVMH